MKKILCFGEVLWDTFNDGKKAGGAPMNVAMHLAQQQMDVTFASRIGDDASGDELIHFLEKAGLYSPLVQTDFDLPTCEVTVHLDKDNQATYNIPEPVSWDNIQADDALLRATKQSQTIIFGSLASRGTVTRNTLLKMLDGTGALKVFDVNLRAPHYTLSTIETLTAKADVVKMNEEEAALLIGGSSRDLKEQISEFRSKYHSKTICVTRGAHGAIVWHDHEFYESPGCLVDVVDTVGAGDAFLATFVSGMVQGHPMQQIVDNACYVGAFVAGKRGATPAYDQHIEKVLGLV